jgi:uncharacterized membrane protein (GlpM family)
VDREGNRQASTLDMVILFSMPAIIVVLLGAIWYFAVQLNAAHAAIAH